MPAARVAGGSALAVDGPRHLGDRGVLLPVGRDEDELRARHPELGAAPAQRLPDEARHRRAHPPPPSHVVGGGDHPGPAHRHRLLPQLRPVPELHRSVEHVKVDDDAHALQPARAIELGRPPPRLLVGTAPRDLVKRAQLALHRAHALVDLGVLLELLGRVARVARRLEDDLVDLLRVNALHAALLIREDVDGLGTVLYARRWRLAGGGGAGALHAAAAAAAAGPADPRRRSSQQRRREDHTSFWAGGAIWTARDYM